MRNSRTIHKRTVLAILASKISHALSSKRALHEARFARFDEQEALLGKITDPGESLLIGQASCNQILKVTKTPQRPDLGNMLVVARTGGGKGLLAIPQLLTWPGSVIVNDIKGDLTRCTSGYRSTFSDVYVVDPTGVGNRYDPLAGIMSESDIFNTVFDLLSTPG